MPRPTIIFLTLLVFLNPLLGIAASTDFDVHSAARQFFPTANKLSDFQGTPPAIEVSEDDTLLGYVFLTRDMVQIPAYSGQPVDLVIGLDMQAKIVGAQVVEHHEPILLVGIPESKLDDFANAYIGKAATDAVRVGAPKPGYANVDAITGATVTVIVVNRTIMRAVREIAKSRQLIQSRAEVQAATLLETYQAADWQKLSGDGSIRRLHLTHAQVADGFVGTQAEGTIKGVPDNNFIDMYYTYLNAPTIGRNLLGERQYKWLMGELKPDEHAIAVMANGEYSFKGSGYVRGGIFDRVQLVQNQQTYNFRDLDHYRLSDVYLEGMPHFAERSIFIVRKDMNLELGAPWSLELLVRQQIGPVDSVFSSFVGEYDIPERYVERPAPLASTVSLAILEAEEQPMWVEVWEDRTFKTTLLLVALGVLVFILLFQDMLIRYPNLLGYLRTSFLLYTSIIIGWYLLGQLSVVNVLTFANAVLTEFKWETFLIDPIMFILWSFVAVTLLLWGRGIYCGWLCPFGALQKLINQAARVLRVPQFEFPHIVHERLWALKYLILLGLFAVSLHDIGTAERYAEIEPFKTAITLQFMRELPFVLYALGLLLVSAFNCKFYCKYLCPLGAALAIPSKLRLYDWLRRRKECGKPCQVCARECEIQAINDTGDIHPSECHYCLDCQVTYLDNTKCPPLAERRKRHEKAERAKHTIHSIKPVVKSSS